MHGRKNIKKILRTVIAILTDPEDGSIRLFFWTSLGLRIGDSVVLRTTETSVNIYPPTWSNISKFVFAIYR